MNADIDPAVPGLKNRRKPGIFIFRTLANIFKRVYINKMSVKSGNINNFKLKGE